MGIYQITTVLWYEMDEESEEPRFPLVKVTTETHRSALLENEVLYYSPEGDLIFYQLTVGEAGSPIQEFRFFFDQGKLAGYEERVAPEEEDYRRWSRKDASKVFEMGADYQSLLEATL